MNEERENVYFLGGCVFIMVRGTWALFISLLIISGSVIGYVTEGQEEVEGAVFPYPGDDWAWSMIGTEYAQRLGGDGEGVVIAVMDTGIDYTHPDLKDRMWEGIGYDFVNDNLDPMDKDGHGTHVAGIIASVAPEARLMALKVLEREGGRWIDVSKAIRFARENGADIISMSFGSQSAPMARAIQVQMDFAYRQGVLMIGSAGNDGIYEYSFPASNDVVMAVSAVDVNMERAEYSNLGSWIELAAPGGDHKAGVISTVPGGNYEHKIGTSMACPFVTGVAALMMSTYPEMSNDDVRSALQEQAIDLGDPGRNDEYGYGLVNAYRAVGGYLSTPPREFEVMGGNSVVELYWDVPWYSDDAGVLAYRLYRSTDGTDYQLLVEVDEFFYDDIEVENELRYHYYVTAVDVNGEGMSSDVLTVVPRETPIPPSPPRYTYAAIVNNNVYIGWREPLDNGGSTITGYNIYRDDELIDSVEVLEYYDRTARAGETYVYSVSAMNGYGESLRYHIDPITVTGLETDFENDDTQDLPFIPIIRSYVIIILMVISIVIFVSAIYYYKLELDREEKY